MVDEMEALRDYLVLQESLALVTEGGIYCEEAPKGVEPPFLLLASNGGEQATMSPISRPSIRTVCYATTAKAARDMDMVLRDGIVNVSDSTGRIISAKVEEIGEMVVDRDWPEWFCCEAGYSMVIHN